MDLGLRDRTYILTGATGGLGLATAQVLVEDDANVVVSSRTTPIPRLLLGSSQQPSGASAGSTAP